MARAKIGEAFEMKNGNYPNFPQYGIPVPIPWNNQPSKYITWLTCK